MAKRGVSYEPAGEERRWDLAVERQRELRPLLDNPNRTRAEVEAAARQLNVHTATVYRLLARYAVGETAQAVVTGVGGWKAGRPRLLDQCPRIGPFFGKARDACSCGREPTPRRALESLP